MESGREPNVENQGCGLDTTFKKSTPEHYKWGMREPNGTPKGYNPIISGALQGYDTTEYFYLLWKIKPQALGK